MPRFKLLSALFSRKPKPSAQAEEEKARQAREETLGYYSRLRQQVIEKARGMSLNDAAFAVARFDQQVCGFGKEVSLSLMDIFPDAEPEEITLANRKTWALLRNVHSYGDALLAGRATNDEIDRLIREEHPGFSDSSYDRALLHGLWLAR